MNLRYFLGLTVLITLAGCGSNAPKLAKASGKVTYKNAPLKFGSVIFLPDVGGKTASSEIKPDGTFELRTNQPGDGALVGTHRVRITCNTSQDPNFQTKPGMEITAGKSLIPTVYNDFDTSPLKNVIVNENENNVFNFELVDQ